MAFDLGPGAHIITQQRVSFTGEHLSIQHTPRMRDFSKNDTHQILGFRDSRTLKRIITALRSVAECRARSARTTRTNDTRDITPLERPGGSLVTGRLRV